MRQGYQHIYQSRRTKRKLYNFLCYQVNFRLKRVPKHRVINGNYKADKLRPAVNFYYSQLEVDISILLWEQLILWEFYSEALEIKRGLKKPKETSKIWPIKDEKRMIQVLKLPRNLINLIAVIIGQWPFERHASRLNFPCNDLYRRCKDKEDKPSEHLLRF